MAYVKRMVMQGFKSFARKTEIPFEDSMNVIVGPNGSGKSNITDALCFVLGRLSIKSIRAAKAANLLFSGNKLYKASQEASVELVFDNSDKTFSIDSSEVHIKRIVRRSGQSIYKINEHTRTRQELLELLAQAGIDPNGFNIILQGEIQSLVKATPEERRKIIEEVAGISVYETRKHKSLRELEKTEEKLKEVSAVLRERAAYLKNLDKERQEAMSYQKLEETIKRCKASIIARAIKEKEGEMIGVEKIIEGINKEIEKTKKSIVEKNLKIEEFQEKIDAISKKIQLSSDNEQENLHREMSDLKAELAGLEVRRENYENRISGNEDKLKNYRGKVKEIVDEISNLERASPKIAKGKEEQRILQNKLDFLEQQRRRFYNVRAEVSTLENQREEKERFLIESRKEISLIEQNIDSLFSEIRHGKSAEAISKEKILTKKRIEEIHVEISGLKEALLRIEKENAVYEEDVGREKRVRDEVFGLKICFICKQEVDENHKHKISEESEERIKKAEKAFEKNEEEKNKCDKKIDFLENELGKFQKKLNELEIDGIKIENAEEKKDRILRITHLQKEVKRELGILNEKFHLARESFEKLRDVEVKYDEARLSIQELSFSDVDTDSEISIKQREVNRLNVEIKAIVRDLDDSRDELKKILKVIGEKGDLLERREKEEERIYNKFHKLIEERTGLQDKQKVVETDLIGLQHTVRNFEEKINHNKISKAQFSAQLDALKTELAEFGGVEILNFPLDKIRERLQNAQFRISKIGSVNMRALEIFDQVEEQCRMISEKVEMIGKEKEKIMKIIDEIDKKKKKSFLSTLNAVNEYFTRNFSQLSRKGAVSLELENKKEPFEGGLTILVKVARGKYFDITSLSGGEKTMVALSLIFAIQEYKPYCFYIFDEIDAALDKHNSELLAALIKKYMTSGQYIIITHNDTLISEATNLYGVSMQENLSKIVSLKV